MMNVKMNLNSEDEKMKRKNRTEFKKSAQIQEKKKVSFLTFVFLELM